MSVKRMDIRTTLLIFLTVVFSMSVWSRGADIPFGHVILDTEGPKDPWAKMAGDIDGDTFPDVAIGGRQGPLVWYAYPAWSKTVIADGGYKTVDGELGDVDGDGDLDVVMGGLLWYENPRPGGDPAVKKWEVHKIADHPTHDVELADLDRDGDLDIVTRDQSEFGHKAGNRIYLWRQNADATWTQRIINCPHGEGIVLGDIDRDEDADIVIGGIWFENTGDIVNGAWNGHRFADWHPSATVQVADIDGDARPDIVLSPSELKGQFYKLSWFEAPSDPRSENWTEHIIAEPLECVIHGLVTADINGDGMIDVVSAEMHQGADPDEVAVFINHAKGSAWTKQIISARGSHLIRAADIGNDGDTDIIGANWSDGYQPVEMWENISKDLDSPGGRTLEVMGGNTLYKPVPINVAEAVIEPFWTPDLSGLNKWTVEQGNRWGLRVWQDWSAVNFEWASKPATGPALRMYRDFNVDCSGYDCLLVRLTAPKQSTLKIAALTDLGERVYKSEPESENVTEHSLDLRGAKLVKKLTLEIEAGMDGPGAGWFRWIGLQNTELLNRYMELWDYSQIRWDKHIRQADQISLFKPRYGIFLNADELEELRKEHRQAVKENRKSRYAQQAAVAKSFHPEKGIHEFVDSGGHNRSHGRVRDQSQARLSGSPDLAVAALVLRDADVLRMAARYALSLAMSEHWDSGFMSHLPASPWEDRAFRRSYTAEDIAMILDLASEAFTETGRNYLMRRLAEEGIGPINFVTWRHEYIFHCNQLAYFNTGRMYAYLVLERQWPRVKPYTDLAYQDAVNNLENVIQPDGGTLEGPGYFNPIVRENYKAIRHYARSRGRNVSELVPEVLKSTADYAAVVASITADDAIPICDSGSSFRGDTLKILSELMQDSYWTTMYNKLLLREGKPALTRKGPPLPAYISLPHTGYIASARALDGHQVKILIMGHKAGADHTHEDKGSFVLEFANQTFAMDLGICEYDDPVHAMYKHCQRHNMLVPTGLPERAHPRRPLPVDVKPTGQGDERTFHARIDATAGWSPYYRKWIRIWDSPSPDKLIIHDEYVLTNANAVEFYWQTKLPVRQDGGTVIIQGQQGRVSLEIPSDCSVRIDRLPLAEGQEHNRIAIQKTGSQGVLEITVHLSAVPAVRN